MRSRRSSNFNNHWDIHLADVLPNARTSPVAVLLYQIRVVRRPGPLENLGAALTPARAHQSRSPARRRHTHFGRGANIGLVSKIKNT